MEELFSAIGRVSARLGISSTGLKRGEYCYDAKVRGSFMTFEEMTANPIILWTELGLKLEFPRDRDAL